ncbi:MAG: ferredoxin domain-containing protein [Christensenellales bacterium]|jgi:uncharacterized ferredoxin-like protein
MALTYQQQDVDKTVLEAARQIANAARTAPKAKGEDNLVIAVADREEIGKIAKVMIELNEKGCAGDSFVRDAENLLVSQALVLIGTKIAAIGLDCGLCGFENCADKQARPSVPCAFNTHDLGIAVGSAAAMAADMRIDNRVMYSAGVAVCEMGLLGKDVHMVMGLPLCVSSKSPYFDRNK